jgi:hypothetical protein
MKYSLRAICFGGVILSTAGVVAQSLQRVPESTQPVELPDAPRPQVAELEQAQQPGQPPAQQPAESNNGSQSSSQSGSQPASGTQQPSAAQSQHDKAAQQIKKQEQQRAFGIIPSFNTLFTKDATPLSKGQKMQLAFRSSIDPFTFAQALVIGGYRELGGNYYGYGWGAAGYAKRAGSAYVDSFLGNMIGNGFLPGVLHQEPRYFRLGHGNFFHRVLYSAASAVRCKHDGMDRWEPNYSNVAGNFIAAAISNVYYPPEQKGWEHTFGGGLTNTATGIAGAELQEFWFDIAKKIHHKSASQIQDDEKPKADQPQNQPKKQ